MTAHLRKLTVVLAGEERVWAVHVSLLSIFNVWYSVLHGVADSITDEITMSDPRTRSPNTSLFSSYPRDDVDGSTADKQGPERHQNIKTLHKDSSAMGKT